MHGTGILKAQDGVGEMAHWIRACVALSNDLNLVTSTHVGQLTNTYNFSSKGSDALFLPLLERKHITNACIDTRMYT